jgi:hypothetical protein
MAKGCGCAPKCTPAPTILRRVRRLASLLLLALVALASCGGGDSEESVEDILNQAFRQEIKSADLQVEAELDLQGGSSGGPLRIEASGPFRTNEGKLPSVDVDLRVGTDGGGQTIQTGFLSTGERAFVKFEDVFYEQPPAQVRRANRAIAKNQDRRGSLRSLGLDPRSWLGEATDEGEEEIGGVETRHVAGTLEVAAVMRNLNAFVRRSGSAIGGATGQRVPEPLSAKDISQVEQVVKDPSFDVYVGKDDDIIRRVSGRVEFQLPEEARAAGGLEGGTLTFSVELRDVNGDQEIEAPANARPLSKLTESLGAGALGLGGVGSDSGGGAAEGDGTPAAPDEPDPPSAEGDNSGGGGAAPDASGGSSPEAFRAYAECLDKARPEDTDALQKCAELLQP